MSLVSPSLDMAALLLAGGLVARRGHASTWRTLAAAGAFLCAFAGAVLAAALGGPPWTEIVAMSALAVASCAAAIVVLVYPLPRLDLDSPSACSSRRRRLPQAPWNGGGAAFEPYWWPAFERDFESYLAQAPSQRSDQP